MAAAEQQVRERQYNVRLNEAEAERAERVAAHHGLTVAYAIRMLLAREYRLVFGDEPTGSPPAAPASRPRTKKTTRKPR